MCVGLGVWVLVLGVATFRHRYISVLQWFGMIPYGCQQQWETYASVGLQHWLAYSGLGFGFGVRVSANLWYKVLFQRILGYFRSSHGLRPPNRGHTAKRSDVVWNRSRFQSWGCYADTR